MILTPVTTAALPALLAGFAGQLAAPDARRAFAAIARPDMALRIAGRRAESHRRRALRLAGGFGMTAVAGSPKADFSWDGARLRGGTEAYVLLHEVAHFQLAAPARRGIVDFGLGAGPETGERDAADRAARLFGLAREREEAMASLLGILWEVALGQPALASFLDQNWLEGADKPAAAAHFTTVLGRLRAGGFLDAALRPTQHLRCAPDPLP